jgi:hypothetical protein
VQNVSNSKPGRQGSRQHYVPLFILFRNSTSELLNNVTTKILRGNDTFMIESVALLVNNCLLSGPTSQLKPTCLKFESNYGSMALSHCQEHAKV